MGIGSISCRTEAEVMRTDGSLTGQRVAAAAGASPSHGCRKGRKNRAILYPLSARWARREADAAGGFAAGEIHDYDAIA